MLGISMALNIDTAADCLMRACRSMAAAIEDGKAADLHDVMDDVGMALWYLDKSDESERAADMSQKASEYEHRRKAK